MSRTKSINETKPGLLKNSEPVFLAVAKILKPHALRGEVSAEMLSDFPDRLQEGKVVFLGENHQEIAINSIRKTGKNYLFSFKGHSTRDSVESFRNVMVYIKNEVLPDLAENEYYHHDLLGMVVIDMHDKPVGVISEIITTGANDVYVITGEDPEKKEILIPAIRSAVKQINLENRIMRIELPEWY